MIAITAVWCRFPGCDSPEALWDAVLHGRDLVGEGLTRVPSAEDPVFAWAMEGARGVLAGGRPPGRGGLVLGNMFLPTRELVRWAGHVWHGHPAVDPRSRFSAGLPALEVARELGLEAGGFALDAACATSLYALKLACDKLRDGEADWMLAGAVSHADETILDQALGSVGVLSPTHRSRPFHDEADGMVWSEGAAYVLLRRLEDAVAAGEPILGVVRGIGLGNTGHGRGLLAPSERGEVEAVRRAYEAAGLSPADVPLVECHATGNALADLIEVRALKRLFPPGLRLGSVRSNLGHPITASGFASLIKVLFAFREGIVPPSLHGEPAVREVARAGFRVVTAREAWEGRRRAGINAFGFGGNNAHLIVEAWGGQVPQPHARPAGAIAVVAASLRTQAPEEGELLPQQAMMLAAAKDAMAGVEPGARAGAIVGLQCDATGARSAFGAVPGAEAFLGRLTNLTTNRLNHAFDLRAPSYAVAAEQASGLVALRLAMRALQAGEADTMLVGAVDLAAEPVHEAATGIPGGDAAVALVLERLEDAGDRVLAVLTDGPAAAWQPTWPAGRAHAAEALVELYAALQVPGAHQIEMGGFHVTVEAAPQAR